MNNPEVVHIIPRDVDVKDEKTHSVFGVAVLGGQLFVVRQESVIRNNVRHVRF